MNARGLARSTALLALIGVGAAACSGNTATGGPSGAAVVTTGPATQAPATQAPVESTSVAPSLDLSSFHAAVDLEKLIPSPIGGIQLQALSVSGDQMAAGSDNDIAKALGALGKKPSDLSVAFGQSKDVSIFAFQVKGVSGATVLDAFKAASGVNGTLSEATVGGKSVTKVVSDGSDVTWVYTVNDVIFSVTGGSGNAQPTDAILNETFSKLP